MRRPDAPIREAMRGPAMLALALWAPAAMAQPAIERGRALYETRCIACHEKSVHQRESRKAQDFGALRREVERWSTNIGGEWRAEELDAVAAFLNDRYYRFTCPPAVCRDSARAGGGPGHGG